MDIKLEHKDEKWRIDGKEPAEYPELINKEGKIVLYGVYDTRDNVWLGDESGPKRFDDYLIARIAAQIVEIQVFGNDRQCRYRAREIPSDVFKKKDDVKTKMGTLEALTRKENGEFD